MIKTDRAQESLPSKPERRLPALAVSRGIGVGRVVYLDGERRHFFRRELDETETAKELARLRSAIETAKKDLHPLSRATSERPTLVTDIFDVHLLILDSSLIERIETAITERRLNAEWAIRTVTDQHLERQLASGDPTFQDKIVDIEDVAERLLSALAGSADSTRIEPNCVVVARELRPSTVIEISNHRPAALITEHGGWTSHTSILARELGLPMVSGVRNLEHFVNPGDQVIVDGDSGEVIVGAHPETLVEYRSTIAKRQSQNADTLQSAHTNATAANSITIRANLDRIDAYPNARRSGAAGIGLFRSESLVTKTGYIPSEDEQVVEYLRIANMVGDDGARIRTFDVGVDQLEKSAFLRERNPALGLRSIRLGFADESILRGQIRAVLRASYQRRLDLIVPMITSVVEIERVKAIIDAERSSLNSKGIETGEPALGVMIETPAAVITIEDIAASVDFLCLGTNDLVQYLLAVDRDNQTVADFYQTLHPAVLRSIKYVIEAARHSETPVSACGEMAGSPFYVPVLIGLGIRDLSINTNSVESVRRLLNVMDFALAATLAAEISPMKTADEIEDHLRDFNARHWSDLFPPGLLEQRRKK